MGRRWLLQQRPRLRGIPKIENVAAGEAVVGAGVDAAMVAAIVATGVRKLGRLHRRTRVLR
jgi:hypothetical protein